LFIFICSRKFFFFLQNKIAQTILTTLFIFIFESSKIIELKITTNKYIKISIISFVSICFEKFLYSKKKILILKSNLLFIKLLLIFFLIIYSR